MARSVLAMLLCAMHSGRALTPLWLTPSRRDFVALSAGAVPFACPPSATAANTLPPLPAELAVLSSAQVYTVRGDSSKAMSPTVKRVKAESVASRLGQKGMRAVWLGEHHNSKQDHLLQAAVIRKLRPMREQMAVGLEAVQQRFQPVLDAYVAGDIDEAELEDRVEWRRRWVWSFSNYVPVFRACRELTAAGMPTSLLALNVDSEDLSHVERGGLPGLDKGTLQRYIPDAEGFGSFAGTTAFKEYVAYVLQPSYATHKRMGILRSTITGQTLEQDMSFRNFFSGRVLWDEAMATTAAAWCKQNSRGMFIGLVGADHVKFGCGVPGRCARQLGTAGLASSATIMLNPGVPDTRRDALFDGQTPQKPRPLRGADGQVDFSEFVLQLRFYPVAGDNGPPIFGAKPEDRQLAFDAAQTRDANCAALPLADFLMFSKETGRV